MQTFGRDPYFATVSCPENKVISMRHCMVRCAQDGWYAWDLHSRNGTQINGIRLRGGEQSFRLRQGDRMQIGSEAFVFEDTR